MPQKLAFPKPKSILSLAGTIKPQWKLICAGTYSFALVLSGLLAEKGQLNDKISWADLSTACMT